MPYLYGDSSASELEVNYIQLLRDAVDFSVDVLLAIHRIRRWEQSKRERRQQAENELERLAYLETRVTALLHDQSGVSGTAVVRAAAAIERAGSTAVATEAAAVRSALSDDISRMDREIGREREGCVRALEALLLKHDLPETSRGVHVQLIGGSRYQARLLESALHLESVVELEIGNDTMFSQPLEVRKLDEHLEVAAPEKRGWLHKTLKVSPQKLSRLYIVEILRGNEETTVRLRATADAADSGFDIVYAADGISMVRVGREGDESPRSFNPQPEDATKLQAVRAKLDTALTALALRRTKLLDAQLDGKPLDQHDNPAIIVERLVTSMSPVINAIAGHSLTPGELVLKRVLADDRREEIFVSKAELERRLDELPADLRKLFEPLGLGKSNGKHDDEEVTAVAPGAGRGKIPGVSVRTPDEESGVIQIEDRWLEEASGPVAAAATVDKALADLDKENR